MFQHYMCMFCILIPAPNKPERAHLMHNTISEWFYPMYFIISYPLQQPCFQSRDRIWVQRAVDTVCMCVLQSEIERLREEISQDTETTSQAVQNSKIQQLELTIQNLQVCAPVHNTVCGSDAHALVHVLKVAICALLYVFKSAMMGSLVCCLKLQFCRIKSNAVFSIALIKINWSGQCLNMRMKQLREANACSSYL